MGAAAFAKATAGPPQLGMKPREEAYGPVASESACGQPSAEREAQRKFAVGVGPHGQ